MTERDAGFSLVEAMVAVAVFALAGVGLVQLQTHSIDTFRRVEDRALAEMAGQEILATAITTRTAPPAGVEEGVLERAGRQWKWRREITPSVDPGVLQVTVAVQTQDGRAAPVRMRAFRALQE